MIGFVLSCEVVLRSPIENEPYLSSIPLFRGIRLDISGSRMSAWHSAMMFSLLYRSNMESTFGLRFLGIGTWFMEEFFTSSVKVTLA